MKTLTSESRMSTISENMKLALRYSFIVSFVFAIVFVIANLIGLSGRTELRFINYFLLFPIIYSALKKSYNNNGHKIEYFGGLSLGFLVGALGQLWYSFLFFFYLHIDHAFMLVLLKQFPAITIYPEISISFIMLAEGVSVSLVIALSTMQYFKMKRGRWATSQQ